MQSDRFTQLQQQMRNALLKQHPEWVQPDGASPTCDLYEKRLAEVLEILTRNQKVQRPRVQNPNLILA